MKTFKKIALGLIVFIALGTFLTTRHAAAATTYQWSGNNISDSANNTYSPAAGVTAPVYLAGNSNTCGASGAILLNKAGGSSGKFYPFSEHLINPRGGTPSNFGQKAPELANISGLSNDISEAHCDVGNVASISISGTPGAGGSGSGNNSNTDSSCEANFVSPFAWIVCPVLSLADSIINSVYGQVENQLCFNTGATSLTNGVVCKSPDSLAGGVKTAWNVFKDIASALLVVVMLVMVFSQAIGGGPFDAYAVRKTLPKLVAAVIVMQLSFVLLKWAIDLTNDVGSSIGSLMMAPFGGPKNMSLQALIGHGVSDATGTGAGQAAFDVFATIAAIGGAVWAIPALPLLALYVIAGVFIAFFVLILRKLLIIMLVMLAPVALILWVLPGTERYWKQWSDNFTKLLAMFPLIMAMLAAGRILAYITANASNGATIFLPRLAVVHMGPLPVPYFATATGFADLAIIIGAFFAPYFLLPKTFSWGGQALGAAGRAVERITNQGAEPGKKFLKNREESYRAERRRKSQERFADPAQGFSWRRPWQRPVDLARAGKIDPTLGLPGSRRRQTAMDAYVAAGEESTQKDIEAARQRIVRKGQEIRARGGNWDRYFQTVADGGGEYFDKELGENGETVKVDKASDLERVAARTQLATLGAQTNWRYLESYFEKMNNSNSGMSNHERAEARKFFDDNVQKIQPKLPHIYNGIGAAADSKPEVIGGMHGVEVEAILGTLAARINDPAKAGDKAKNEAALLGFLRNFQEAASNPNIRVDNGALRAVKGFLDDRPATEGGGGTFRAEINNKESRDGRESPGRNLPKLEAASKVELSPEISGELAGLKTTLADRIDPVTGTYSTAAPAQTDVQIGQEQIAQPTSRAQTQPGPTRTVSGYSPGGYSTQPGNVVYTQPGSQPAGPPQPVELVIDHEALTESIRRGFNQAARDNRGHQPGDIFGPEGDNERDDKDN